MENDGKIRPSRIEIPLTPPVEGGKPFNHVVERSTGQAAYMEEIIERMEHLPKDPRLDNPLKITNDARKAGLDFRLIDPEAEDYPGSKVNAAVERIYKIWLNTAEDRETIRKRMGAFSKNIIRSIREISPEAFQRIMGSRQLTGNH